jgi:hypothetical protein
MPPEPIRTLAGVRALALETGSRPDPTATVRAAPSTLATIECSGCRPAAVVASLPRRGPLESHPTITVQYLRN